MVRTRLGAEMGALLESARQDLKEMAPELAISQDEFWRAWCAKCDGYGFERRSNNQFKAYLRGSVEMSADHYNVGAEVLNPRLAAAGLPVRRTVDYVS